MRPEAKKVLDNFKDDIIDDLRIVVNNLDKTLRKMDQIKEKLYIEEYLLAPTKKMFEIKFDEEIIPKKAGYSLVHTSFVDHYLDETFSYKHIRDIRNKAYGLVAAFQGSELCDVDIFAPSEIKSCDSPTHIEV